MANCMEWRSSSSSVSDRVMNPSMCKVSGTTGISKSNVVGNSMELSQILIDCNRYCRTVSKCALESGPVNTYTRAVRTVL